MQVVQIPVRITAVSCPDFNTTLYTETNRSTDKLSLVLDPVRLELGRDA